MLTNGLKCTDVSACSNCQNSMGDDENEEDKNDCMSKVKMIQILRQKITLVTMILCKEQVLHVHQLIFCY